MFFGLKIQNSLLHRFKAIAFPLKKINIRITPAVKSPTARKFLTLICSKWLWTPVQSDLLLFQLVQI